MKSNIIKLKRCLMFFSITMIACVSIVFSFLYIDTFYNGFIYENNNIIKLFVFFIISIFTILTVVFFGGNKEFIYKLFFLFLIIVLLLSLGLYFLKVSNFLDKFNSIEGFRAYIEKQGDFAPILFTVIQFLQVVVLPIPAFITVGAGVLLFGPLKAGIYSSIGIIIGSIVAYFIGKIFGYKVVCWLMGKENVDKGLKMVKGKDKVILTFMFLFPFFPDDILCFVAGITTIKPKFFIIMIFITRIISIFTSTFSMNNSLIPYNTWWGIVIWAVLLSSAIVLSVLVIKYGEKIEGFFTRKFRKK